MNRDDDEPATAICWPVALRSVARIPGTRTDHCARCGQAVWVAPSSDLAAWHVRTLCVFCVSPERLADALGHRATPEQLAEFREYLERRRRS